jgi:hypothetical protein
LRPRFPSPWITLAAALAGCNEFGLRGRDDTVVEPIVVEETFEQTALPEVDVLWVIDDTASMAAEQEALATAFGAFAAALDELGLAWQVGVTTTDVTTADAGALRGDPWILTPDTADLGAALAAAADVGTGGSAPEAGLGAAWLALTDPTASGANRGFRRSDAALHVVVVSDEDDHSATILGDDPATAFLDFLDDERSRTERDAVFSAVVGDLPSGCAGDDGAALPGATYAEVADATGGTLGSVCSPDLAPVTQAIGEASASYPTTFELQAIPVAETLRVAVDGTRLDDGWNLQADPPAIVFDDAPPAGAEISVRYEVAS